MKLKHTKSPWVMEKDRFVDGCIVTAASRAGMVEICSVTSAYLDDSESNEFEQEQLSNAKLISSAPELLDALQALVSSLSDDDEEGLIEHSEQMIAARLAIAKATGNDQ